MKKRKGKRRVGGSPKRSRSLQIVLLDQRPLRQNAATECRRAMARLEKARTEWQRFQQEDKAAFDRWVASTFGALLSRLREIDAAIQAKEMLIEEVELEMMFGTSRTPRTAFRAVQKRRENPEGDTESYDAQPPPPPPFEADEAEEESGDSRNWDAMPEFEREMLFEEFVSIFMGIDPDRLSEKKYAQMFAEFEANVIGQKRPNAPSAPQPQPKPGQSRLKELYRILVRRLHPDLRADNNTAVSSLWHDVQEAYARGNIERLETLLALTDLQANAIGEQTTLSQMLAVLAELRSSLNSLQRNLRAARKDPAWNFSRLEDRSDLEKEMRGEFEAAIVNHEYELEELEETIASWSQPPKARKRSASRNRQAEFFF